MKKYLILAAAVVFAAGLSYAETGGQSKTTQQSSGTTVQKTATAQPAAVEKTYEGTIVWVKAADKAKKTSARINVLGADGKAMTFVVKGNTVIEGKDKTKLMFSSLKKDEKVMVTYKQIKERYVADSVTVES